MRGRGET